jgi:hypothetical protein
MSKELVCPFCNKKLEPIGTSGQFQCGTWGCDASFNFIATRDVWEYVERTSKTLEAAVNTIETITATPLNSRVIHDVANKFLIDFGIEKKGGNNEK